MTTVELAASFLAYCQEHRDQRFWQALRNWSKYSFVGVAHYAKETDTFETLQWRDSYHFSNDEVVYPCE